MSIEASAERTVRFLGNNVAHVVVSGEETDGRYAVMEVTVQPGGGANALHTDRWRETFAVLEGEVEWTLEREGQLETWRAGVGEVITVPEGAKHMFRGAGETPSRMLAIGGADFERFFRALAEAWPGPYDREATPQAVGPVFESFGMRFCA